MSVACPPSLLWLDTDDDLLLDWPLSLLPPEELLPEYLSVEASLLMLLLRRRPLWLPPLASCDDDDERCSWLPRWRELLLLLVLPLAVAEEEDDDHKALLRSVDPRGVTRVMAGRGGRLLELPRESRAAEGRAEEAEEEPAGSAMLDPSMLASEMALRRLCWRRRKLDSTDARCRGDEDGSGSLARGSAPPDDERWPLFSSAWLRE